MHALLVAAALAAGPAAEFPTPEAAAAALAGDVRTGTLLFSEGDCLAVKTFTGSPYTHVAAVVVGKGGAWVYDSQNGVGVRRQPLAEYLAVTRPDDLHVLHPAEPFDVERADAFATHLEQEVGRSYSVAHHLTGRRTDGVHCAEYLTDALTAADVVTAERPPRVSPASLRRGLLRHGLYAEAGTVAVALVPEPERPPGRNWCERMWLDTKDCCAGCWTWFRGDVLCR